MIQYIIHYNTDIEDDDNDDTNDDLFPLTASIATSPIDSSNNDDNDIDVVYEVDDSDNDTVLEKPAESAQAELGMQIPVLQYATHLLFADHLTKDWVSPIYVFFRCTPYIEYVDRY